MFMKGIPPPAVLEYIVLLKRFWYFSIQSYFGNLTKHNSLLLWFGLGCTAMARGMMGHWKWNKILMSMLKMFLKGLFTRSRYLLGSLLSNCKEMPNLNSDCRRVTKWLRTRSDLTGSEMESTCSAWWMNRYRSQIQPGTHLNWPGADRIPSLCGSLGPKRYGSAICSCYHQYTKLSKVQSSTFMKIRHESKKNDCHCVRCNVKSPIRSGPELIKVSWLRRDRFPLRSRLDAAAGIVYIWSRNILECHGFVPVCNNLRTLRSREQQYFVLCGNNSDANKQ